MQGARTDVNPAALSLAGWSVERTLGQGGLSEVFLVRRGDRRAALKLLRASATPESLARFRREQELLAGLSHPGIARLHDVGVWQGRLYMLLDYVPGRPLRDLVTDPPQPPAVVAGLALQLAEILAYAHQRGVYHRDVTPANVLVDRHGLVHLLDFGVATGITATRLTAADHRWPTTPAYAPPEWFQDRDVDGARADAYALGVLLHELLTGDFAFPDARPDAAPLHEPLDPGPTLPKVLRDLVARLTATDAEARASVEEAIPPLAELAAPPALVTLGVTAIGSVDDEAPWFADPSEVPRHLGRYVALRRLGAGGMGLVYLAYDPELRREVAVKVLHAGAGTFTERERLRREAQAMAQLRSPHIVAVYDVGQAGEELFLAMEYVEGTTLAEVLAEAPPRPWRERLRLLLAAGRGLVAAHDAGLVHRDFKPANVLVGEGDAVKVTDFGLARVRLQAPDDPRIADLVDVDAATDALTRAGAFVGTPAYMAPEQFLGAPVDARTDQFSYCVALHEALFGARPFAGTTVALLSASVRGGVRVAAPRGDVPAWIVAVIDRGLDRDPERRWPSMQALLEALELDPGRRRRRRIAGAGAATAVAVALAGAAVHDQVEEARCRAEGAAIFGRWDDAARARVHQALIDSGVGHAEATWTRIEPRVDAWAEGWSEARTAACEADRAGAPEAGARIRCLDRMRWRLDNLLVLLAEPRKDVADDAVAAVTSLPDATICEDPARRPPELDVGDGGGLGAVILRVLQQRLEIAVALSDGGLYEAALAASTEALTGADTRGSRPLRADALRLTGSIRRELGDFPRAESELTDAWLEALRSGHDTVAVDAATDLVFLVGVDLGEHERGRMWGRQAEAMLDHLGAGATAYQRWELLRNGAVVDQERGALAEARKSFTRARELAEASFGASHYVVGRSLNDLGIALYVAGEYDAAQAASERAVAIYDEVLGTGHPATVNARMTRAGILLGLGDFATAAAEFETAVAAIESSLGAGHPLLATALHNLAAAEQKLGRLDAMLAHAERALAIDEATRGSDAMIVGRDLNLVAIAHRERGDYAGAAERLRRAVELGEATLGAEHRTVAGWRINLGRVLARLGRFDEAIALQRRGLADLEAALGESSVDVGFDLVGLAKTLHERGTPAEARAIAERALAILEGALGPESPAIADAVLTLARIAAAVRESDAAEGLFRRAVPLLDAQRDRARLAVALEELGALFLEHDDAAKAVEPLDRAVALREAAPSEPAPLAAARFALARALAASGGDPRRALKLAEAARQGFAALGPSRAPERAAVDEWVLVYGPSPSQ